MHRSWFGSLVVAACVCTAAAHAQGTKWHPGHYVALDGHATLSQHMVHISEVRKLVGGKRIDAVEDVLAVGQKIQVEITKIDDRGKLSLSPVVADEAGSENTDDAEVSEESAE